MTRHRRQKPHAFDCVATDGGRYLIRADESGNIASGWFKAVPLYKHPAPAAETFMITISRKRLGGSVPVFQFIAQPNEPTANFIAGCVLDAMADASGAEYDYTITPALIGSAQEGFAHVLRAAREIADVTYHGSKSHLLPE